MKNILLLFIFTFLMLFSLFILHVTEIPIQQASITDPETNESHISLPYSKEGKENSAYLFKLVVEKKMFQQDWVWIIPDDCLLSIKVNSLELPLGGIKSGRLCDWENGFIYPLGRYLKMGINSVDIIIKNSGGNVALNILPGPRGTLFFIFTTLLILSMLGFAFIVLKYLKLDIRLIWILLAGILIRFLYFHISLWNVWTHDPEGHIEYIEFIANNFRLPERDMSFVSYHPPLYFILSAVFYKFISLFTAINNATVYRGLQFLSLTFNIVYLTVCVKIFQDSFVSMKNKIEQSHLLHSSNWFQIKHFKRLFSGIFLAVFASALFVFWPSDVIHSVRIGNDALVYPLYALTLFFIIKWDRDKAAKSLYLAVLFAFLSIITKTNSILLMGIIALLFIWELFKNRKIPERFLGLIKQGAIISVIFLAGICIGLGGNILFKIKNNKSDIFVGNIIVLHQDLRVGNTPANYLYFDAKTFITEPYTSAWNDKLGRQYFWNYLLKTGLFGEFNFGGGAIGGFAVIISFLMLFLIIFTIAGLFWWEKKDFYKHRVLIINFIVFLIAAISFRISVPFASSNDFRYILPVLISFSFIYAQNIKLIRNKGWYKLSLSGMIIGALFVFFTTCFFLAL